MMKPSRLMMSYMMLMLTILIYSYILSKASTNSKRSVKQPRNGHLVMAVHNGTLMSSDPSKMTETSVTSSLGQANQRELITLTDVLSTTVSTTTYYTDKMIINHHNFKYVLNNPHVCTNVRDLFVLVYVHSAPSHYKNRVVIRQTWGNPVYYKHLNFKVIFVMGNVPGDTQAQQKLEFEYDLYKDIVQEDFKDSYRNLTYKAIAALKWVKNYCRRAKFVLKTDDDVYVNMYVLLRHLYHLDTKSSAKSLIYCHVWYNAVVFRNGKWKTQKSLYDKARYPPYCSGAAFVLTMDTVIRVLNASQYIPYYWVDDVYITGILPEKAGEIKHIQLKNRYLLYKEPMLKEKLTGPKWFTYMFSHMDNLSLITDIWGKVSLLAAGQTDMDLQIVKQLH